MFISLAHFRQIPSFVDNPFSIFVMKITAGFFLHFVQSVGRILELPRLYPMPHGPKLFMLHSAVVCMGGILPSAGA
jgi:hypothetical protein